jgi:hypothetical protein
MQIEVIRVCIRSRTPQDRGSRFLPRINTSMSISAGIEKDEVVAARVRIVQSHVPSPGHFPTC